MPLTRPAIRLLLNTLSRAYRRHGLEGRGVLLAVSGGADSTALLVGTARVSEALGMKLEVATLDHGLRREATSEGEAVARLAYGLGLRCHRRALHLEAGAGVEARARAARYEVLEALRRERGLAAVATGHTADDQAETLLMRLARGSALRGARGIHAAGGALVRPLLERTREDVLAFLREADVAYFTDPMNADATLFRTRIRQGALPALSAAAGFSVTRHLATFARVAAEDDALLAALADAAWERVRVAPGTLDAVGVRALEPPLRRRVLARLVAEAGALVDHATLLRADEAVARGGSTALSGGLRLKAAGGRVRCARPPGVAPAPLLLAGLGAQGSLGETGWHFSIEPTPPPAGMAGLALGPGTRWPLTVRTRRPGDRIRTGAGQRKLQDVLVDLRVPEEARHAQPVVADAAGTVMWIPGVLTAVPTAAASGQYIWASLAAASNHETPTL
ncbi:tRNA lysidine(34) synthetase TilS [Corallococcus sp. M34]|uniref:tRNA lysidine(34) synthetase TilS n=1 Tax=Citreicoccus inhibens TaxID=2849499 RepID=UPI001C23CDB6|nr:tRNA lysidine(34) synthetase TilS [Citreicoccus inhibens]MBU8896989.1 tRNA lysidine(34) synthetase TilS [Citreicoccus inhibens]